MSQKAIFGKINPAIQIAEQTSLFNPTPAYKSGDYIAAVASPYVLGTNEVNFRVYYGNCAFDAEGNVVDFKSIYSDGVTLSGTAISTWGEDDSVILEALATQQGTTVTQIVTGTIASGGMFF